MNSAKTLAPDRVRVAADIDPAGRYPSADAAGNGFVVFDHARFIIWTLFLPAFQAHRVIPLAHGVDLRFYYLACTLFGKYLFHQHVSWKSPSLVRMKSPTILPLQSAHGAGAFDRFPVLPGISDLPFYDFFALFFRLSKDSQPFDGASSSSPSRHWITYCAALRFSMSASSSGHSS